MNKKPMEQTQAQLNARIAMERKVVRHLLRTAKAAGYMAEVVDDGGYTFEKVKTERDVMDAVFAVDEANIGFLHPSRNVRYWAFIVLGNGGWDAIADCTVGNPDSVVGAGWNTVMDECSDYSDKLCEGV